MVYIKQKTHSAAKYATLSIMNPGSGGLNIQDLDYTLLVNQSPKMLNMMLKNGTFGKRYGQKMVHKFSGEIKAIGRYHGSLFMHVGTSIVEYKDDFEYSVYTNASLVKKGMFFNYNKMLYYLSEDKYLVYNGTECKEVVPYIPDVVINRHPDGTSGDTIESYNRLGAGFKDTFHGDGKSTVYKLAMPKADDFDTAPLDDTKITAEINSITYTEGDSTGMIVSVDRKNATVTFKTAPPVGQNNVVITAYKTYHKQTESIMKCKCHYNFGGNNNSRLFLAGNGTSTYYYSDVFDASYFPEMQYALVGNSEDDITGFGSQYNILVVFKPTEMYGVTYSYTTDTNGDMKAIFSSQQINDTMGCDMPDTIQYVGNRLTWGSTQFGICTLCSTTLADEKNVQVVSRNINGGYRTDGLLGEANLKDAVAVNFEGRYMLCVNNVVYAWDYTNTPYVVSDRLTPDQAAKALAWYKWDNIGIKVYKVFNRALYYSNGDQLNTFDNSLSDFGKAINAYYQTPMLDFGNYEMLKTIKKAFFEVRADVPTIITIKYLTDEDPAGEEDPEKITVGATLWDYFKWTTFAWSAHAFAKTFARKCSVKKVCLFGVLLENNLVNRDLTLSGIKFEYTDVKEIK